MQNITYAEPRASGLQNPASGSAIKFGGLLLVVAAEPYAGFRLKFLHHVSDAQRHLRLPPALARRARAIAGPGWRRAWGEDEHVKNRTHL